MLDKEDEKYCEEHDLEKMCTCICHEEYKLIIHDHACCSHCFKCSFRERCPCKYCNKDSV